MEPTVLPIAGPLGRTVRLLSAGLCGVAVWQLARVAPSLAAGQGIWFPGLALFALPAVWVLPYVIDIGLGRSWGRRSVYVVLGGLLVLAAMGFALKGTLWTPALGIALMVWLGYTYLHLGVAFLIAAAIATPGCEMGSLRHLASRLRGREYGGVICPAFLHPLDRWEAARTHG